MNNLSLHNLLIDIDGEAGQPLTDFSTKIKNPIFDDVEVIFRNQENKLIGLINEFSSGAIFGCVAWLTSKPILKALANCQNVQIVVQKEDFLRPDIGVKSNDNWKKELWTLYNNLKCDLTRYDFNEPVSSLSVCGDPTVDAIRCVGNHNKDKNPAFPRAHHKFLVFCKMVDGKYIPIKLWTGSFNLTKNATMSFENAIIFTDNSGQSELISSFLKEHHQIFSISENVDWTENWATPEFRIGT